MFRSARFRLTLFYLAIILVVSLSLTFGTRWLAERTFFESNQDQRGALRNLVDRTWGIRLAPSDDSIREIQVTQEALIQQRLNMQFLWMNLGALAFGGVFSYWFAGRTLKPIEKAHEAQKQFAADASHELRTPLTSIRVENEVFLRQKDFTKQEAREQITSNLEEIQRLEQLSNNLLDLTKYEGAQVPLGVVDIESLVAGAVEPMHKPAAAKNITITTAIAPGMVSGNQSSLVRVLTILLDNALKYSPENTEVRLEGQPVDGRYRLRVVDQGSGIDPADLPHVFDRLYRGDKARSSRIPGHGLGLSLAKQIAQANNARLSARNQQGSGAVFTLSLVRVQDESSANAQSSSIE